MSGCFLVFLFFSTSSNPFTLKLLNTMDFQLSVRGSDCRIIEECLNQLPIHGVTGRNQSSSKVLFTEFKLNFTLLRFQISPVHCIFSCV